MNHFARCTAPIDFFVNPTCCKTCFKKDCTLAIKFVFWNFFIHSLFFFSFYQVFSSIQGKIFGNFEEYNKVSWWICEFVESACRKSGLLYHLCWNIWVINLLSAMRKNQGLFMSGLGFDLLANVHFWKSGKNFDLAVFWKKNPNFCWNWRLRRQLPVSVPEDLCAQSCYWLQWEFCLSTKKWTGTKSRCRGNAAVSPEN